MSLIDNVADDDGRQLEAAMAALAIAIADPSRVRMLCALMDGRAWTATELSAVADVTASTASAHLNKLLDGGLLRCLAQGRHRYYSLAGRDIAGLLENLMSVSMRSQSAPLTRTPQKLRHARTCYDHLAGELAVEIYNAMQRDGCLAADGSALTDLGQQQFARLGVALNPRPRRKACCPCLDWSERRYHLGGDAGAALLKTMLEKGWLSNTAGYREITVSEKGRREMGKWFQIALPTRR